LFFEKIVKDSDSFVFNIGAHYTSHPTYVFADTLIYASSVMENDKKSNSTKRHLFRGTYPEHFGGKGIFEQHMKDSCTTTVVRHYTDSFAEGYLEGRIPFVSMYDLLRDRGNFHSLTKERDCLHWCYSYSLWFPILYMTFLNI
jgi:hypothetical protein